MAIAEWDAIACVSAKNASDAPGPLRLKKEEEGELRAKAKAIAIPATPNTIQVRRCCACSDMDAYVPIATAANP